MTIFKSYITLSELSSDRKYSKSFYQSRNERNTDNYFNRAISYDSNNAYNDSRQKRNDRSFRVEVTIKIEKISRNRDFDRDRRNRFYDKKNRHVDEEKYRTKDRMIADTNYSRDRDKEKFKIKIYMIQNEAEQECSDDHDDYNRFDDLKYFDSDYDEKDDDIEVTVSLAMTSKFICRRCKKTLKSNNAFHRHLKICMKIVNANAIVVHINFIKITISLSISIRSFDVDVNKNIDTDYDFKKYQYAFTEIFLTKHDDSTLICADTETEITLMNAEFFSTIKNVLIRTMIIFITVRELNTDKHFTDKYVIVFMYFLEKNKNDTTIKAKIIRKIHLINDLKTNMLLKNDILDSKKFDIFTSTSSTYIESCEITISIFIKNRFMSRSAFVHFTKTRIISSRIEISILIHKISLSERDYLFEPAEANFFMYSHIIDIITNVILMRNDNAILIKIFRNLRLNKLIELKHSNALMINSQFANLAIRRLKSEHKNSFFQMTLKDFSKVFLTTVDKKLTTDIVLSNDITVHDSSHNAFQQLCKLIEKYSSLWTDQEFANLSKNNWMRLSLKTDWKAKIKEKAKIYSLEQRDKALVDETFNKLHTQKRLNWTNRETSFSFSIFVVWRDSSENKKERVVVDIKSFNAISQSDAYSLSLQNDIIQTVQECRFISVIDCASFFYQWRVHSEDRHKFTVVSHREQKTFNVAVMSYRNSSVYVQRQIDRILRSYDFARAYVNDIVIFSDNLNDHIKHLRAIFQILKTNNISVNLKKTFLKYSSVTLLKQHVTFFDLSTDEFKLRIIANLKFFSTLDQLETYLKLTDWFRQYIEKFAAIFKSLQKRKTKLLQHAFKFENVKKNYFSKTKFTKSFVELNAFELIQKSLFKSTYLIHFNSKRQLYIDLDFNKKMKIDDIIYYVNDNNKSNVSTIYSVKQCVQSIMFFNRLLTSSELKYWSTELELTELIWIFRKIRHLIDFTNKSAIIYTNHETFLTIVKQIFLSTSSTDKLNFRFMRASDYIQRFDLVIRHKSSKFHLVSDALFRLSIKTNTSNCHFENEKKLDVLYTTSLIEMSSEFRAKLIKEYSENSAWKKINKLIDASKQNDVNLSFTKDNELIYRIDSHKMLFISQRLCISASFVKIIIEIAHDSNHSEFDRTYQIIVSFYYIKNLSSHIKNYLKHCSKCTINQTKRHKSYEVLQSILSLFVSFHIITIDFVLVMSLFHTDMNNVMTITCKFFKRIVIISNKDTWNAFEWTVALLHRLNIANWELSKVIIFDRNRKFLSNLWIKLFQQLKVDLLYSTAYHSQTNEASERINQTLEIALRFHLQSLSNFKDWSKTVIDSIQRAFNNSISFTDKTSNEICYDFISMQSIDLLKNSSIMSIEIARMSAADAIAMTQMYAKSIYDENYHSLQLKVESWILLRLHKKYEISFIIVLNRKLSQQYVKLFQIVEKIDTLTYRLNFPREWKIWSVVFIAQLEPSSTSNSDSFERTRVFSSSITMKNELKFDIVRSFEIERIIAKRFNKKRDHEYFVRWLEYESQDDFWRNVSKLQDVIDLINDFNSSFITNVTSRRDRKKIWCIDGIVNDFLFLPTIVTQISYRYSHRLLSFHASFIEHFSSHHSLASFIEASIDEMKKTLSGLFS